MDNPVPVEIKIIRRAEEDAKDTAGPAARDDSDDTYYEDIETLFPEKWANRPDMFGDEPTGVEADFEAPAIIPGEETTPMRGSVIGTPFDQIQQQSGGTGPEIPRVVVEP